MNRLVMGQKNACYIGQRAALVTYSNINLAAFLAEKNITLKSEEFPFEKVEDFLLVYLDDLVIWSSKKIKNSTKVHLLLIEFLLWCTIKLGFKFSKSKVHIMPVTFKFLSRQFNTIENSTSIPDLKLFRSFVRPNRLRKQFLVWVLFRTSVSMSLCLKLCHILFKKWSQMEPSNGTEFSK